MWHAYIQSDGFINLPIDSRRSFTDSLFGLGSLCPSELDDEETDEERVGSSWMVNGTGFGLGSITVQDVCYKIPKLRELGLKGPETRQDVPSLLDLRGPCLKIQIWCTKNLRLFSWHSACNISRCSYHTNIIFEFIFWVCWIAKAWLVITTLFDGIPAWQHRIRLKKFHKKYVFSQKLFLKFLKNFLLSGILTFHTRAKAAVLCEKIGHV